MRISQPQKLIFYFFFGGIRFDVCTVSVHAELPVATTINDKLLYSGVGSKLKVVVGGRARLKNLDKQNKGLWYVKI